MHSLSVDHGAQASLEVGGDTALDLAVRNLTPLLSRPGLTELCINGPGEVFLETGQGWTCQAVPSLDFDWCWRFAKLVANYTRQRVDESHPLLCGALPSGERVQIAMPPATLQGRVAISIRRPAQTRWSIDDLAETGALRDTRAVCVPGDPIEGELRGLLATERYAAFLRLAVRSRRNILVSGPTGSGKTTWTKALIAEIPPDERLITIEDAPELALDAHPNHVRLFYSKDDQGLSRVTPKQLLEACLRMKPDRILLAELRSEEAFDYLRNVNSGHPGSITSVHASSAALAFEQLVLLIKQSPGGRGLARRDIRCLLRGLVDVVIQCGLDRHRRSVREIWLRSDSSSRRSLGPLSGARSRHLPGREAVRARPQA